MQGAELKKVLAVVAAAAFVIPAVAMAAPSETKVTGGGKTEDGSTIAFTAQGPNSFSTPNQLAKGQVQYVGRGEQAVKVHGTVKCVAVGTVDTNGDAEGGEANGYEIAGLLRDGVTKFNIKGTDGGQPTEGTSTDLVAFDADADDDQCDLEDSEEYENLPKLANGNIKIHNTNKASTAKTRKADMRKATAIAKASKFQLSTSTLALTSLF